MKRIVGLLALMVVTAVSPGVAQDQVMLPCGLAFECATEVRTANATATWRMTFDRRWPGIYDVVHWELTYSDGRRAEYLADLLRPDGEPARYRFFTRERKGVWYTLGIRKRMVWRQVRHEMPEQDLMAVRLRQLLGIAAMLRAGADPAWIRF